MFSRMLKLPDEVRAAADVSSLEVDHPRRRAVPGAGQAADDRVVRADPARVLRGHRGQRLHLHHSEDWLAHPGTVGRAVLSDIRILDDDGNECPTGTPGTVWFAGATDFEYFGDPEKTASSRRDDGKTSTVGDVGLPRRGRLPVPHRPQGPHDHLGRREHLPPGDGEPPRHPPQGARRGRHRRPQRGPRRRGQGGRPARRGRRRATTALERELIAFCRDHLAHFKCPRSIDFVDELPRLPTGKLYKGVLRERYWADHATRIV